jgi:hypothetical protein
VPLWREGVLCGSLEGEGFESDIADACRRIADEERFADLRPLIRAEVFEDPAEYVQAVAADLLKGGPDPALSVPIAAALDKFAARHGAFVARASATSIAQRAEEQLGAPVVSVGLPILLRASADRLLEARDRLACPLTELRAALNGTEGGSSGVREAAREYAAAFDAQRESLTEPDDGHRAVAGTVMIGFRRLPVDAVLRSSVAAYRSARGLRGSAPTATAVPRDALVARGVLTMIVRPLGPGS